MKKYPTIKEYGIPCKHETYVIAEIGLNHNGDMTVAKQLIDAAIEAGVDAVKFQTYQTEKRTPKGSPIFDILKKCELTHKNFLELADYSTKKGVQFFSTPFDVESLDYLCKNNTSLLKIASFDLLNKEFLRKIAEKKKTVILSVGMSNILEIQEAVQILTSKGGKVCLLHCVSAYPTPENEANLLAIRNLEETFEGFVIGQSDHTNDILVPLYAVALGARIIEKHFKLDEAMECVDAPVSITKNQMEKLVKEIRRLEQILGSGELAVSASQEGCVQYRRKSQ